MSFCGCFQTSWSAAFKQWCPCCEVARFWPEPRDGETLPVKFEIAASERVPGGTYEVHSRAEINDGQVFVFARPSVAAGPVYAWRLEVLIEAATSAEHHAFLEVVGQGLVERAYEDYANQRPDELLGATACREKLKRFYLETPLVTAERQLVPCRRFLPNRRYVSAARGGADAIKSIVGWFEYVVVRAGSSDEIVWLCCVEWMKQSKEGRHHITLEFLYGGDGTHFLVNEEHNRALSRSHGRSKFAKQTYTFGVHPGAPKFAKKSSSTDLLLRPISSRDKFEMQAIAASRARSREIAAWAKKQSETCVECKGINCTACLSGSLSGCEFRGSLCSQTNCPNFAVCSGKLAKLLSSASSRAAPDLPAASVDGAVPFSASTQARLVGLFRKHGRGASSSPAAKRARSAPAEGSAAPRSSPVSGSSSPFEGLDIPAPDEDLAAAASSVLSSEALLRTACFRASSGEDLSDDDVDLLRGLRITVMSGDSSCEHVLESYNPATLVWNDEFVLERVTWKHGDDVHSGTSAPVLHVCFENFEDHCSGLNEGILGLSAPKLYERTSGGATRDVSVTMSRTSPGFPTEYLITGHGWCSLHFGDPIRDSVSCDMQNALVSASVSCCHVADNSEHLVGAPIEFQGLWTTIVSVSRGDRSVVLETGGKVFLDIDAWTSFGGVCGSERVTEPEQWRRGNVTGRVGVTSSLARGWYDLKPSVFRMDDVHTVGFRNYRLVASKEAASVDELSAFRDFANGFVGDVSAVQGATVTVGDEHVMLAEFDEATRLWNGSLALHRCEFRAGDEDFRGSVSCAPWCEGELPDVVYWGADYVLSRVVGRLEDDLVVLSWDDGRDFVARLDAARYAPELCTRGWEFSEPNEAYYSQHDWLGPSAVGEKIEMEFVSGERCSATILSTRERAGYQEVSVASKRGWIRIGERASVCAGDAVWTRLNGMRVDLTVSRVRDETYECEGGVSIRKVCALMVV